MRSGSASKRGPPNTATYFLLTYYDVFNVGDLREFIHPGVSMSDVQSLADRIEQFGHALKAVELAELLSVSPISIYKLAKANRLPCFRIGSCVRFDPRAVARWLRQM